MQVYQRLVALLGNAVDDWAAAADVEQARNQVGHWQVNRKPSSRIRPTYSFMVELPMHLLWQTNAVKHHYLTHCTNCGAGRLGRAGRGGAGSRRGGISAAEVTRDGKLGDRESYSTERPPIF